LIAGEAPEWDCREEAGMAKSYDQKLDEAVASFYVHYHSQRWFVSAMANHQKQCIDVLVEAGADPISLTMWDGFQVVFHQEPEPGDGLMSGG
jgi:hypothetical protein